MRSSDVAIVKEMLKMAEDKSRHKPIVDSTAPNVVSLGSLHRKDAKLFVAAQNVGRKALFHFLPTHLLTL